MLNSQREWDRRASARVTRYVANSRITQRRIADFLGRDSEVIHPPVEVDRFRPGEEVGDHLLFVGELLRHKRVDVALEAARLAGLRMKVVGGGPELRRLSRDYGDVGEFLGRVSDEELARLYPRALALVVPPLAVWWAWGKGVRWRVWMWVGAVAAYAIVVTIAARGSP